MPLSSLFRALFDAFGARGCGDGRIPGEDRVTFSPDKRCIGSWAGAGA
jgi:hypothetical protein